MSTGVPRRLRPGASAPGRGPAAVFLDRDGVLNDVTGDGSEAQSPRSIAGVRIADGAPAAADRLRTAGFVLIVVTNQPDVARGLLGEDDTLAMTGAVVEALDLDDAYVCVHDGPDDCGCRKPLPGLVTTAADDWGISLADSWLVGDRWVDVGAGEAAGVRTVLLERTYSMDASGGREAPIVHPDAVVSTLADAVAIIVESVA